MDLNCPYCAHPISAKRAKPGRYAPQCPKCSRKFLLVVEGSTDGSLQWTASPLDAVGRGGTADSSATVTQAPTDLSSEATSVPAATEPARIDPNEATADMPSAPVQRPTMTAIADSGDAGDGPVGGVPSRLGGYRVIKLLGRGAMGVVYLARQLSLDRDVALKTIDRRMSQDPVFIARFTREAYAAAQLQHHNAVQIYDMGTDGDTHFFSMEFVDGETLAELLKRHGRLEPLVAAGYVLQAARALKFAHDHGMVHRDVKPGNIMLNRDGVVKVADLGLVKVPSQPAESPGGADAAVAEASLTRQAAADVTRAGAVSGTPAYMAPEQSVDFRSVDARADIYSLGCTFYDLLTGRPPFHGTTAMEVITKHRNEPVVRPDVAVEGVPAELSSLVLKMMAKRPEDRYQDLGETIRDLEQYLGINETGSITRWPERAKRLGECAQRFRESPLASRRRKIVLGVSGAVVVLALLGAVLAQPLFAAGVLGAAAMAWASYFAVSGFFGRTYLFQKVRELAFGARWRDLVAGCGFLLVSFVVLCALELLVPSLVVGGMAVAAGVALYVFLDRKIAANRAGPIGELQQMIKELRLAGQEEAAIQRFIAQYSGDHWEEFFEALFGYEGKLAARRQWGRSDAGKDRPRFRAWRDPIVRWIDARLRVRREAKERVLLAQVEEQRLLSEGIPAEAARQRAENVAIVVVARAAELREPTGEPPAKKPAAKPKAKKATVAETIAEPEEFEELATRPGPVATLWKMVAGALDLIVGPGMRLLAGCVLLAGCLLWAHQNGMLRDRQGLNQTLDHLQDLKDTAGSAPAEETLQKLEKLSSEHSGRRPLQLSFVPSAITGLFNSINAGVAGLVLFLSAFSQRLRTAAYVLPAAAIMLFAHTTGLPGLVPPLGNSITSLLAGLGLTVAGVLVAGRSD